MSFCTLDEAFAGQPNLPGPSGRYKKSKKQHSTKEGFSDGNGVVPPALVGSPGTGGGSTRTTEDLLVGPPPASAPSEEAISMDTLFPMPGETGGADEWQKAFTLEGSTMPQPIRPDGSVPVAGKQTLWRQIPTPQVSSIAAPYQRGPPGAPAPLQTPAAETIGLVPSELSQRLDVLTRQLENLTTPTQLQGTAELFLFVAIGLLLLLAIDTLLRFAVAAGTAVMQTGGGRVGYYGRVYRGFR